jgi:hypothetical protein
MIAVDTVKDDVDHVNQKVGEFSAIIIDQQLDLRRNIY